MNIVEALRDSDTFIRLSAGNRWLAMQGDDYTVYEHTYGQYGSKLICQTIYESEAVKYLLGKENN